MFIYINNLKKSSVFSFKLHDEENVFTIPPIETKQKIISQKLNNKLGNFETKT